MRREHENRYAARMDDAIFSVSVPRLTTPRLLLREYRASDFDAFAANLADPAATQFVKGAPDRRTAWRMFSAGAGLWMLHGAGWWAVELRETGELIGQVGAFFRETSPDLEVGWTLHPKFWRRGLGTEAAKVAHGFERRDARRIVAHISTANLASIKVSRNLGMHYEKDVPLFDETVGLYAIER